MVEGVIHNLLVCVCARALTYKTHTHK